MSNKDYSQAEIDNIIEELLTIHDNKLMSWEINTLKSLRELNNYTKINNQQRDWLVTLYDRIGEAGY